ncbi:hypothetical protein [Bacillus safensis]|uniref:hypothetical protein n=1 Tax=Bacillus safensis TaxID=561879 RepID=UPI000DAD1821|nr:hypothetical protein [Bacillus safensis]
MSINELYKNSGKSDMKFWRHVGVSIDLINELSQTQIQERFKKIMRSMNNHELLELSNFLNINLNVEADNFVESFNELSFDVRKEIIILKDFLSRKKKTVTKYYDYVSAKLNIEPLYKYSSLCKLYQLLNNGIFNIIQIYTWHNWDIKSTGIQFSLNKKITYNEAYKIPTEYAEDFVNDMYKHSVLENSYKVFSFGEQENEKIVTMLYRQVNDASRPDFDEPLRNKEVVPIMFQIDVAAGLLEIRSKFQKEKEGIKKYIEKTFNTSITEIKPEVFNEYEPQEVISAFLEGKSPGNKEISDFIVSKVVFRSSPLINSPSITFNLNKGDVLPSIKDAHVRECIDLESLKDIESLTFKYSQVSRTIRSTVLEEGNIIFSLDDRGIDPAIKEKIQERFLCKFGVPLNKLISNSKFTVGKADFTDYLMTTSTKKTLFGLEQEIYCKLIEDKIISEKFKTSQSCKNPNCDYTSNEISKLKECPNCGNLELIEERYSSVDISLKSVQDFVKKTIKTLTDWELNKDTEKIYFKNNYKFINLENTQTNETLQFLIHQGAVSNKVLEKINRSLTPTIIVFVGIPEKNLEKYNNNCIFPINFGRVYNTEDFNELFIKVYESIKHRTKSYLSSVAAKSLEILRNLSAPEQIGTEYSPTDFEEDVFNVLKDIFPNADKWGNKMSGKEVPEGIFSVTYTVSEGGEDKKHQYVFSYDCKLNKNTRGYDLSKSEQRKAFDYVEMLNQIKHIKKFSNKKQLSAHIFISNNFDANNYQTMVNHFYNKLPDGYDTRPIFLPLKVLTYLHSEYRKNHQQLNNARNVFMENLYRVLITDRSVINKDDIEEIMEEALDEKLADYSTIETDKVRRNILKKLKNKKSG